MSNESERYYQASGAVTMSGAAGMIIAGVAVAAATSFPLVWLPRFMESVIVALMCGLGQGMLVGFAIRQASRMAQVRNPDFARFVGLVAGLFAVYFAWVSFVFILSGYDVVILKNRIEHPLHLLADLKRIAPAGVWSIIGYTPRGWELYSIWIAEATLVICLSAAMSASESDTYCENCNRWTRDSGMLLRLPSGQPDELRIALEREQYDILDSLRMRSPADKDRFELKIDECTTCRDTNILTIQHVIETTDDEGNPERNEKPVVANLIVPYELVEHLRLPAFEGCPEYESPEETVQQQNDEPEPVGATSEYSF